MYFGFWLLTWWFASSAVPKYLELTDEASKKGDWKSVTLWMTAVNEQSNLINMSLTWGIGVPILALLVAGLIYWLYRGFRSRLSTTSTE
jgi:hypothetical protein